MSPSARTPYWTLPALVALLAVPSPWFGVSIGLLFAYGVGARALRIARARSARRHLAAAPGAGAVRVARDASGLGVDLSEQQLSAHGLILGASGSGKSTSLLRVLTECIDQGRPVIAIDLKGSPAFLRTLAAAAEGAGRPFALWSPDGPGHWNPLAVGNPTELKDRLIASERFTEPHYQRAAERYLQTTLTVLAALHPAQAPTLSEVVALTEPRRLGGALRGLSEELRNPVQDYLSGMTADQLSAVRGLGTRLALLTESHTGRYLAPPPDAPGAATAPGTIDLRGALRGETVVAFSLNSSRYGSLAAQLGTMLVQDLISAAGGRLEDPAGGPGEGLRHAAAHPLALVGIDEFSALGADHLVRLLARGRESGVSLLVATQEMADLERAAAGLSDQVLGNTAFKLVHRQDVPASALRVAQMVGTERVIEETRYFGGRTLREHVAARGSRREAERFIIHPNHIKNLRTGEAVRITKVPETQVDLVTMLAPRVPATRGPAGPRVPATRAPVGRPPAAARAPAATSLSPPRATLRASPRRAEMPASRRAPRRDGPER